MITTGTKWFWGLGIVSLLLAAAYGWATGGNGFGPLTMGYKGAVGDHIGYGLLMTAGLASVFHGLVLTAVRDASAEAEAEVAGVASLPPARPAATSYWPAVSAFGAALVLVGVVTEPLLAIFGLIVLGVVLVEWTVQTWAESATGDPATNRSIRNRLMNPIEYPVAGALAVGVVIISFSRVFLAVSHEGAVWVAVVASALVLLIGAFVAARPRLSSNVVVGLLLVAALVTITLGVVSGISGEREFHPITDEEEH